MIVVGLICLILGFIFAVPILWTIGIILLVIGLILALIGMGGREIGAGRIGTKGLSPCEPEAACSPSS